MRFASREKAILSQWEVGAGLVPGGGPMARVPRLIGRGRALEVLLGADDVDGELAERYGYVNRSFPDADLDSFVDALASRISTFDRQAIAQTKRLIDIASLPADADIAPEWDAFIAALNRPAAQQRIKKTDGPRLPQAGRRRDPAGSLCRPNRRLSPQEIVMDMDRKVAVITGASHGIGAALVAGYRRRGYRVVATARSLKPTNDPDVLAVPGDIADRNTAERVVSEGLTRFARIDSLVNNAGIFIAKPFTEYTEADYRAVLGVNTSGFFYITQLAIAEMERRESGHVVQITTTLAEQANSRVPALLA
jgi:hypothetical protein